MANFTYIHLHSDFSNGVTNVDSITKYDEYISRAKECGMKAMAFTEHGSFFGWVNKKRHIESAGMKYIHGAEFYITETINEKIRDNYHCCLYAKNYDGVLELNQLSSISFNRDDNHFYYAPRITIDELLATSDNVLVSTACLGGILHNGTDTIKDKFITFLANNKHRCFLEIQHHNDVDGEQGRYNQYLYELSKKIDVPLIAGTDTHALNEEHLKGRKTLQKAKNVRFENEDSWDLTFKTYDELILEYQKQNVLPMNIVLDAIENTNRLADMIDEFELDETYKYPHLWEDSEATFAEKIKEGIKRRGVDKYPNYQEYLDRIEHELEAYRHNGAIDFMLLMEDIIDWCVSQDIRVGYGRGSVNGSVIAWLLGITEMDSIKHKLNFERFMNVERVSLSDIDTDFPPSRIDEVKNYIFSKAGLHCCDIITFNTIALKGAIKDVCRAFHYENIEYTPDTVKKKISEWEKRIEGHDSRDTDVSMPKDIIADIEKYSIHKEVPYEYVSFANELSNLVDTDEELARKQYPDIFELVDLVNGTIVSVGSHPCFTENELVLTTDGYKKIKDIVVGDNVITHVGNIKEVCDVMQNYSDDIYNIKTTMLPIQATGNHPFYVREKKKIRLRKYKDGIDTTVPYYDEPIWKRAEEIQKGDMLGTPINTNSIVPIHEEYSLSFDNANLWWLIGRYIGDGWITDVANRNDSYLVICCNKNNSETGDIVRRLVWLGFEYRIEDRDTVNRIYIKNDDLLNYLRNFGKYAHGKKIAYEVFDLPVDLLRSFILGYISADGNYDDKEREYCITTVSKELALGMSMCIAKVYCTYTKIQIVKEHEEILLGRYVHCKEKYRLRFHTEPRKMDHSFYESGYIWTYCFGVEKVDMGAATYNLSVYDDNSYTVNNVIVHNCGCVVSPDTVSDKIGTFTTSTSIYPISQIYMKEIDSLNYVKLDLLRLDTIEIINETCKLAGIERLTPDNMDITDVNVWNSMRDDTTQIFQWEGKTGDDYIKKLLSDENIKKFQEVDDNVDRMTLLSIGNSAIRPAGASYREDLANGVVRKSGSDAIDEFLKPTFGYLVFQCQIIDFLHQYCGFTMGEADIVRRHFAKKTGTEDDIPVIKDGGYMKDKDGNEKKDHYIKGFIATMREKYGMPKEEAEDAIVAFLQVIIDASKYLFSLNHSQPYSYEGYACGWLRYYYTLEFITVSMNINIGKEDKTIALTNFAKKMGIEIRPPKFRHSKSKYFCDKKENCIYKGIGSIKFMNDKVADELYELRNNNYADFIDLLISLSKTSINSRQLDILIKLDFFQEFGNPNQLLRYTQLFNDIYSKKQFKKEKIKEMGLQEVDIRQFAEKESDKMFTKVDTYHLLKYLVAIIEVPQTSIVEKIKYQSELLGYISIKNEQYKGIGFVTSVDSKYAPKLKVYALANGNTIDCKIDKRTFNCNKLSVGDLVRIEGTTYKPQQRRTETGFEPIPGTKVLWLTKYKKVVL